MTLRCMKINQMMQNLILCIFICGMHSIRIFSVSQNSEKQGIEGLQPSSLIKKYLERVGKKGNAWMLPCDNESYVNGRIEVYNNDCLIKRDKNENKVLSTFKNELIIVTLPRVGTIGDKIILKIFLSLFH